MAWYDSISSGWNSVSSWASNTWNSFTSWGGSSSSSNYDSYTPASAPAVVPEATSTYSPYVNVTPKPAAVQNIPLWGGSSDPFTQPVRTNEQAVAQNTIDGTSTVWTDAGAWDSSLGATASSNTFISPAFTPEPLTFDQQVATAGLATSAEKNQTLWDGATSNPSYTEAMISKASFESDYDLDLLSAGQELASEGISEATRWGVSALLGATAGPLAPLVSGAIIANELSTSYENKIYADHIKNMIDQGYEGLDNLYEKYAGTSGTGDIASFSGSTFTPSGFNDRPGAPSIDVNIPGGKNTATEIKNAPNLQYADYAASFAFEGTERADTASNVIAGNWLDREYDMTSLEGAYQKAWDTVYNEHSAIDTTLRTQAASARDSITNSFTSQTDAITQAYTSEYNTAYNEYAGVHNSLTDSYNAAYTKQYNAYVNNPSSRPTTTVQSRTLTALGTTYSNNVNANNTQWGINSEAMTTAYQGEIAVKNADYANAISVSDAAFGSSISANTTALGLGLDQVNTTYTGLFEEEKVAQQKAFRLEAETAYNNAIIEEGQRRDDSIAQGIEDYNNYIGALVSQELVRDRMTELHVAGNLNDKTRNYYTSLGEKADTHKAAIDSNKYVTMADTPVEFIASKVKSEKSDRSKTPKSKGAIGSLSGHKTYDYSSLLGG